MFCCVRVFKPNILIKGVHLTQLKKNSSIESWFCSYEEGGTYYELKKAKTLYVTVLLYFIFDMSSCRKPEIQNDLPKITKIKWICYIFYVSTTIQLNFKNREI